MADEAQVIRGINWRETFPFTHLFRAFRVAIHPSKLVLGLIALLALYLGGQVLDGLWTPQSRAVPGEVFLYETTVTTGGSSDEFIAKRNRNRDAIESAYADHLVSAGVFTDHDVAVRAAAHADNLGDLKHKIVERRDKFLDDARHDHDAALKAAREIKDPSARDRKIADAEEAYRYAVRNIASDANNDVRSAEEIRGIGLFSAFFGYEARCINGVIDGVKQWNWLGSQGRSRRRRDRFGHQFLPHRPGLAHATSPRLFCPVYPVVPHHLGDLWWSDRAHRRGPCRPR